MFGILFFWKRREMQQLEVGRATEKDQAEALGFATTIVDLEKKVSQDEKTTGSAIEDYDKYRSAHPFPNSDGGGSDSK